MHELNSYLIQVTILDIAIILLYLCGLAVLASFVKKKNDRLFYLFGAIGLMHLSMTFVYYFYTLSNVADAIGYYRRVKFNFTSWGETMGQGADTIYFLLYPLVNFFNLTYFGSYFIFSFVGLIGFYLLFKVVINISKKKLIPALYIFFLPNAHFWTVGIGKDSIIFYAISHFVYNIYFKKSFPHYIIPCLLIGLIRIHILAFILIALVLGQLFFNKKVKFPTKIFITVAVSVAILVAFPIIMERVGAKDGESVSEQFERLEGVQMSGGSSLDMNGKSILIKLPSYLFRPALFDVRNGLTLLAALENLYLLYVFYFIIKKRKMIYDLRLKFFFWYCLISIFVVVIPSAMILVNLGIAMRQKFMVFPFIIVAYTIISINKRQKRIV